MGFFSALTDIFAQCLLPVFLIVGLGWAVQRGIGLDVKTMTRLNLWIFVPALIFDRLAKAEVPLGDLARVFLFVATMMGITWGLTWAWCRFRGYTQSLTAAFTCSTIFINSGNYGLPVVELAFGAASPALALQTVVLAWQNITTFSLGQVIIAGPHLGVGGALRQYLRMPFLYAIGAGLALQLTGWRLPGPIDQAVVLVADGMVPIALLTLGAQLGMVTWSRQLGPVAAAAGIRLVLAPTIAFILLKLLGWNGLLAQHLLITSSFPSAVNGALLAIEYDNEPDFAAQTVVVVTALSALTVAVVIWVARSFL